MPVFPRLTAQRTISTQVAKPQAAQVDFTPLIRAGQEIAQEWQRAKDISETNQAYNNIEQGQADILQRAKQDTDYTNQQTYINEIEKLRTSQQFSNRTTEAKFQRVSDSSANQAVTKIEGMFRNKLIEHQQGELVRSERLQRTAYLNGDATSKDVFSGILQENFDSGFIDRATFDKQKENIKTWEFQRAQYDATTNPEFFIQNAENGYEITDKERSSVLDTAKKLQSKNKERAVVAGLEIENLSADSLLGVINSDVSDEEKTNALQKQVIVGNISDKFAKQMKRLIESDKTINAITQDDVMGDILARTYDLSGLEQVNPKDYLTGVRNIKEEITRKQADGTLTVEDGNKLLNQINTITNSKTSEATNFIGYSYSNVKSTFEENLPPEYRNKALRTFFYDTEGQELSEAEYNSKALSVIDRINQERRANALTVVTTPTVQQNDDFLARNNITIDQVRQTARNRGLTEAQVIQQLKNRIGE